MTQTNHWLSAGLLCAASCTSVGDRSIELEPGGATNRFDSSAYVSSTSFHVSPSLDSLDPVGFLEYLEIEHGNQRYVMLSPDEHHQDNLFVINSVPRDWIGIDDIDTLLRLMDDTSPTSPVYSIYADMVPQSRPTTKGIEAVRLVQGFRRKQYPSLWPVFHLEDTASVRLDSIKQELRRWWKSQGNY